MSQAPKMAFHPCQAIWEQIREEADNLAAKEEMSGDTMRALILTRSSFAESWIAVLSEALGTRRVKAETLTALFSDSVARQPHLADQACADIRATLERDPACLLALQPLLYFKGFHALSAYRFAHALWEKGERVMPLYLQSQASALWGVDIHPAARIGCGMMMDHATGVVIGETALIEEEVSIFHGVTLGGTGHARGDRHPKVRRGALLGAGAKILGNIEIGAGAKIGAGSLVTSAVPPHASAVGNPARLILKSQR